MSARSRTTKEIGESQLRLLPGGSPSRRPDWQLDERTRDGREAGVAQAREVLRQARPPEPKHPRTGPQGQLAARADGATASGPRRRARSPGDVMDNELCDACDFDGGRATTIRRSSPRCALSAPVGGHCSPTRATSSGAARARGLVGDRVRGAQSRHHRAARLRCRTGAHPRRACVPRDRRRRTRGVGRRDLCRRRRGDGRRSSSRPSGTRRLDRRGVGAGIVGRAGSTIGGERSDVRRLLEHALHDSQHHLADVERGLTQLRN